MRPGLGRLAAAGRVFAASLGALPAQQTTAAFRSGVHAVEVHVTVRGADGQIVTGLTKDDFELFDNGKRRDITVFANDVQPIAIALLLDRSGSVAWQADKITTAAETFVRALRPADRAALHARCRDLMSRSSFDRRMVCDIAASTRKTAKPFAERHSRPARHT